MSDEGFVPAGDDASEAVAAAAAAAAALGHDLPEDTASYHHQYGEAGPDAMAAAAGGPHGGVESNRWAKNFEGMAPETLSSGKFSKEESETVRRAVTEYCERRNITAGHLCSEQMDHKQECKGAWMEIARALPHRTVQSVYRHGLRQMNTFKRGAWSEEEVQALLDYVNEHGKKWSGLQVRWIHCFGYVMLRLFIIMHSITCSERTLNNLLTLVSFVLPTARLLFFIRSFYLCIGPQRN